MIAKCALIAFLAVVATASPACQQIALPSCGSSSQSSQVVYVPSSSSESSSCSSSSSSSPIVLGSSSSSAPITRNIVAKGKYPVALKNCGPTPDQQVPITTSRVTAPVQEKPTVRLPASIPAPRVISHCCTCYKTILRPRVQQQIITVPTVQRYIETTHKPVIENIQYEAVPVNCEESSGSSCGSSQVQLVEVNSGSSCGSSQVQTVQVPQVQTVEVPRVQTVEVPRVQVVEVPRVQTVEVPRVQTVEVPRVQVVEVPRVQTVQIPQVQTVQIPQTISLGTTSCGC